MEDLPFYEEKWLRNTITLYLPRLRDLYDHYATVACMATTNLAFKPTMIRLFLWQLYRDCFIPEKGLSLTQTDLILAENPDGGTETNHSPFEKIYFWQFLHSLISIAWKFYGDESNCDGTESILRKVFTRFLEEDIFPNARHFRGTTFNLILNVDRLCCSNLKTRLWRHQIIISQGTEVQTNVLSYCILTYDYQMLIDIGLQFVLLVMRGAC